MTRGDVWLTNLDPTVGSEIRKTCPSLIISPPELHDHLRTVICAPMTTAGRPAPFRIALRFRGLDGLILLDQVRVLDKSRLVRRLGAVEPAIIDATLECLRSLFEP